MKTVTLATSIALGLCAAILRTPTASASGGPAILGGTYGAGGVTAPGSDYRYATVDAGAGGTIVEQIRPQGGGSAATGASAAAGRYRRSPGSARPADSRRTAAGWRSCEPRYDSRGLSASPSEFLLVDTRSLEPARRIELDGIYSFDAISPDGRSIYLVEYADARDPLDYRVRRYDVAAGEFRGGAIVDPDEPDEKMTGQPLSRVYSPDGSWAYTLYGGGSETFVHALDTAHGTAQCIDLEGIGEGNSYYRLASRPTRRRAP